MLDFAASLDWNVLAEIGLRPVPIVRYSRLNFPGAWGEFSPILMFDRFERRRKAENLQLQRPKAFAGILIVGLIAIAGFAAFSATGVRAAPPIDIPAEVSARVAGNILGVDLGPDTADRSLAPDPDPTVVGSEEAGVSSDSSAGYP